MELQSDFEDGVFGICAVPVVSTILEVIRRTTGMRFAAIARVTQDQWVCCAVQDEIEIGIKPGEELDIEKLFRHTARKSMQPVVIDNVAENRIYSEHPIPKIYGFQSYISIPIITKQGEFFGTLCAIDPEPAHINTAETIGMFKLFGELIAFHLHTSEDLVQAETRLAEERDAAELREQFIAILGHDLRNPLAVILNLSQLLSSLLGNALTHSSAKCPVIVEATNGDEHFTLRVINFGNKNPVLSKNDYSNPSIADKWSPTKRDWAGFIYRVQNCKSA